MNHLIPAQLAHNARQAVSFSLHIIWFIFSYSILLPLTTAFAIISSSLSLCQGTAAMSLRDRDSVRKGKEPAEVVPPFGRRDFSAKELVLGVHVLVDFNINGENYTRACVIASEPDEDGDTAVYRLRCADDTQKFFYVENQDTVDVKYEQIKEILPRPQQYNINHGTQYLYAEALDIFEEGFGHQRQ